MLKSSGNIHVRKKNAHYCQRALILLPIISVKKNVVSGFGGCDCRPTLPPNGKKFNHIIFQVGKVGVF